eukprot:403369913
MSLTYVFYYIPEDNEDYSQLNFFPIQKGIQEITLTDIRQHFSVPGEYHFRFQYNFQGQKVWLDLSNENGKLPISDGMIIMKVLRTKWTNQPDYSKKGKVASTQNSSLKQQPPAHSHSFIPQDLKTQEMFKMGQQQQQQQNNRASAASQHNQKAGVNWSSDTQHQQKQHPAQNYDLLFS